MLNQRPTLGPTAEGRYAGYAAGWRSSESATTDVSLSNDAEAVTAARLDAGWDSCARHCPMDKLQPMRARVLSLVLRPISPPLALGLAVAAVLLAAESLLVYLLMQVVPGNLFGVVFLLGVLVVSLGWGFGLGTMTALASALVYAYFHSLQTGGSFVPTDPQHWVAVTVFLVIALSATALAGVARLRAVAADERRREVEASHDELSVLADHQAALRRVATLVARGVIPSELFSAVAEELARCLGIYHHAVLFRYESEGAGVLLGRRPW